LGTTPEAVYTCIASLLRYGPDELKLPAVRGEVAVPVRPGDGEGGGGEVSDFSSPAERLLAILRRVEKASGNNAMQGWCEVFGITERGMDRERAVVRRLDGLHSQLDLLAAQIRAHPTANADRYSRTISELRSGMGFVRLSRGWDQIQTNVSEAALRQLETLSDFLRPDFSAGEADLQELAGSLRAMLDGLEGRELGDDLRAFLRTQLEILLTALDDFRYRGIPALDEGQVRAAVHATAHQDVVAQAGDVEEVSVIRSAWSKITAWRMSPAPALLLVLLADAENVASMAERVFGLTLPAIEATVEGRGDGEQLPYEIISPPRALPSAPTKEIEDEEDPAP